MEDVIVWKYVIAAIVYATLGIVFLATAMVMFDKLTPGELWKEIIEEQNVALAIIVGATALGISQIIASAIHG